MQKKFFRPLGTLFCSALLLGALTVPAMAANDISVKVDDQPVSFTDASPIIRSDRTFVPFRAIFEQMGANVQWDGDTKTVIANRGGREVRFQIGQTGVKITEDGDTRTVPTDVAPFIEGSRTYVPVRFASQSFGACVDWVQATKTVLIVDVEKLMDGYAGAYTYMDDYLEFAGVSKSISGAFAFNFNYKTAMGDIPVNMNGTVSGAESADAAELSGSVKTDITALQAAIEKNEGKDVIDSEIQALLKRLASTSYQAIVSRTDGTLYLSCPTLTELGIKEGGWVGLPLDSVTGKSMSSMLTAVAGDSFTDCVAAMAQEVELKNAPNATVAAVRSFLDAAKTIYGDSAWKTSGDTMVLSGAAGANTYDMRLTYAASGALERVQMTGSVTDGTTAYNTSVDQDADGYQLTLSVKGAKTADIDFSVTLSTSASTASPAVRPTGDVTPIKLS
ncbi:MAG: copper amine oxidase N-terminal domain-containing protein [Butyricicoccus sp.]|nr:copper amine oxidase N-terminal domain-containing protein [Butyricicoccus sp.]